MFSLIFFVKIPIFPPVVLKVVVKEYSHVELQGDKKTILFANTENNVEI